MAGFKIEREPIKGDVEPEAIKRLAQAVLASAAGAVMQGKEVNPAIPTNRYTDMAEYNVRWANTDHAEFWCGVAGLDHKKFIKKMHEAHARDTSENMAILKETRRLADRRNSTLKNKDERQPREHKRDRQITFNGKTQSPKEWVKEIPGLVYATVINRLAKHMPPHLVLSTKRIPKDWAEGSWV